MPHPNMESRREVANRKAFLWLTSFLRKQASFVVCRVTKTYVGSSSRDGSNDGSNNGGGGGGRGSQVREAGKAPIADDDGMMVMTVV